jgi:cob(I)alamin adenosyltransferase
MKIYTKKGDNGTTGLIGGTRVLKNNIRIESYGTVDELNAYVGLIADLLENSQLINQLNEIQDRLFTIGSILANDAEKSNMKIPSLTPEDILNLENWIDEFNNEIPEMRYFILPGGHQNISFCHIARCVCRRAERRVVELNQLEKVELNVLTYLNRLSDYLFILGRKYAFDLNVIEKPWHPRK